MKEIYYLLLLVITGIGSSLMTMYLPTLKRIFKRYISTSKSKSRTSSINDLEHRIDGLEQMVQAIIQQTNQSLQVIDQTISEIDKRTKKRDSDRTAKVKAIVLEYLKELQK